MVKFVLNSELTGFSRRFGLEIQLKTDQKVVTYCLLDCVDGVAVLSASVGKILVYQAFATDCKMASNDRHASAMVYTPLDSITEELQI